MFVLRTLASTTTVAMDIHYILYGTQLRAAESMPYIHNRQGGGGGGGSLHFFTVDNPRQRWKRLKVLAALVEEIVFPAFGAFSSFRPCSLFFYLFFTQLIFVWSAFGSWRFRTFIIFDVFFFSRSNLGLEHYK